MAFQTEIGKGNLGTCLGLSVDNQPFLGFVWRIIMICCVRKKRGVVSFIQILCFKAFERRWRIANWQTYRWLAIHLRGSGDEVLLNGSRNELIGLCVQILGLIILIGLNYTIWRAHHQIIVQCGWWLGSIRFTWNISDSNLIIRGLENSSCIKSWPSWDGLEEWGCWISFVSVLVEYHSGGGVCEEILSGDSWLP